MNPDQHHTGPGQLHDPLRPGPCLGTTAGRRVMMSQRETHSLVSTADPAHTLGGLLWYCTVLALS